MEIKDSVFRSIFDQMPYPAFFHDDRFHLIYANAAYYHAAGTNSAKALGKVYWEVFPKGMGLFLHAKRHFSAEAQNGPRAGHYWQ